MSEVKGYKVFNPDWTCRDFQYEVGKRYKLDGNIVMHGRGFHFCQNIINCFNYYDFNNKNKVAEIIARDLIETRNDKSVTNDIEIIKELSWEEVLKICNTGNRNTGNRNTGNCNTGNRNTGNYNTGNYNTGSYNTGIWNVGDENIGYLNIGNGNIGDRNTGNRNTGCFNTGSWNSIDFSSGFFNTIPEKIRIFNNESEAMRENILSNSGYNAFGSNFKLTAWIYEKNMTDIEKNEHPEYITTGGYLKSFSYKEACKNSWDNMSDKEKTEIQRLPNFDAEIFKEITGIDIKED